MSSRWRRASLRPQTFPWPALPGIIRCTLLYSLCLMPSGWAQPQAPSPAPEPARPSDLAGPVRGKDLERNFFKNVLLDQKAIWTSPARLQKKDAVWLVPASFALGEMLHRDTYAYRALNPMSRTGASSRLFSDAGVFALAGGVGSMYVWGKVTRNEHARETGLLGTQAALNTFLLTTALKYPLGRARPEAGRGGDFFTGGDSFPSMHASLAWSMATVIAHEYPGPLTKFGAYGLATAISAARVSGRRHFVADVAVGSALGYLVGREVYRRNHDEDLPGENIGTFIRDEREEHHRGGSPYVPLDSWVYSAFDRLQALGLTPSGFRGQRPWTRNECGRLLREAASLADDYRALTGSEEGHRLVAALGRELGEVSQGETRVEVESVYVRLMGISGEPRTDGLHFGQTIRNDFGRPFREGFNAATGVSAWMSSGAWSAYGRVEYQHAPSAAGLPLAARLAIADPATGDNIPLQPATPLATVDRARVLDAYVALTWRDWQISFGKQSLWWGPGEGGAMNLSNNAEPITMLRISRVSPLTLPPFLAWLGPMKTEAFLGRLDGHAFVRTTAGLFGPSVRPQPMIDGAKVSFKPTPNLEFGVSTTTMFGGPGFPVTLHTFLRTFSFRNAFPGSANDPGDRRSGFDFSYRIPKLRDRLLIYTDAMTEDEISPIGYPRRSAFRSGVYVSRLPYVAKLDLRVEGAYTNLPGLRGTGSYYFNTRYVGGYTNEGNILGDAVGRQGRSLDVQSRYWFDGGKTVQVWFRNTDTDRAFLGGGGSNAMGATADWMVHPDWRLSGGTQVERWDFPVLGGQRTNVATTLQVTWRPRFRK